ncbi:MAG: hypothetical protein AVDCRST_MAG75-249 [uncultured Propionibacteriaceae bacterium]|uniref:Uncharacterized protein n=1 Tax=uncultured Propionibacteriaceae bacterium TaxID=257457 RepID=A0A6J4MZ53_9ACTN|nr:MAG: hypothetical protein AVDCRST_MAG75-249 [uncultured Propionibacteriaceae bacterium]
MVQFHPVVRAATCERVDGQCKRRLFGPPPEGGLEVEVGGVSVESASQALVLDEAHQVGVGLHGFSSLWSP